MVENQRGIELWQRGELEAAAGAFRAALRGNPEQAAALSNLGMVLLDLGRHDEGLANLRRAAELEPGNAAALNNLGVALARGNNPLQAANCLLEAIRLEPGRAEAHANLLRPLMDLCEWPRVERAVAGLVALAAQARSEDWAERVQPYTSLLLPLPRELQRRIARYHGAKLERAALAAPRAAPPAAPAPRLRIGYVSSDFHNHATAHLCAGMFGCHDRARFEVHAYSFRPDDGTDYRRRIVRGCDFFHDIRGESHAETARRIAADGIHVLIDMKGFCGDSRPEIFALRPAPVQVHYLGYPGSMQAGFIDYLIAARVAAPEADAEWYSEALARMPASYQVNDAEQPIAARAPQRAEFGLPREAFVYCCINHSFKIEPQIFGSWMRILRAVPGSVLWLYRSNLPAKYALWKAAERDGVSRERLVFADKLPKDEHLARLRLADLCLDTHTVNGHTSASDALWAGVPLLTWPGETFAARVAASLLCAVGLPELAVPTQEAYERRAVELARDSAQLEALRARLAQNRTRAPLFDTARSVRGLESAYETMWARHARGERPASFAV